MLSVAGRAFEFRTSEAVGLGVRAFGKDFLCHRLELLGIDIVCGSRLGAEIMAAQTVCGVLLAILRSETRVAKPSEPFRVCHGMAGLAVRSKGRVCVSYRAG